MEVLSALEKKVESLILLIKRLKEENLRLGNDNQGLREQVRQLEGSLLKEAKQVEKELTEERKVTQRAVDDLIKSIDELIESGGGA